MELGLNEVIEKRMAYRSPWTRSSILTGTASKARTRQLSRKFECELPHGSAQIGSKVWLNCCELGVVKEAFAKMAKHGGQGGIDTDLGDALRHAAQVVQDQRGGVSSHERGKHLHRRRTDG